MIDGCRVNNFTVSALFQLEEIEVAIAASTEMIIINVTYQTFQHVQHQPCTFT